MNHTCRVYIDCPLLNRRRRVRLCARDRALELTGHLNQTEIGAVNDIRLAPVRELSAQTQEALDSNKEANICELFELKRVIFDAGRKIQVRRFGRAGRNLHDNSRIVIVLDEIGLLQEH